MDDLKNDIARYLKGELTPLEMHALEKKALSDPFLADALEGAGEVNTKAFEQDVADLQRLIDKRTDQSKKIIPLWNWSLRIAAGFVLIAVSTFVILNIVRDEKPVELAENKIKSEPTPAEQKHEGPISDSIVESKPSLSTSKLKSKTLQPAATVITPVEKPSAVSDQFSIATEQALAEVEVSSAEEAKGKITRSAEDEIPAVAPNPAESVASSPAKKEEAEPAIAKDVKRKASDVVAGYSNDTAEKSVADNARIIKGHVSSIEDGSALQGVNVLIKGTNTGTVTDEEGNYEIALTDKQSEIAFSFIGLQSTELQVSSQDKLDVQMSNDVSQLSEVVVTGYATNNDTESDDDTKNVELASPIGGRRAYKQYLEKSLRYPEVALENKIEGKVTIEFTVETTGTLTDFKVVRGLGYGCDEEVIRLVKEGARWAASKYGDELLESNVKIRLRFTLPKK